MDRRRVRTRNARKTPRTTRWSWHVGVDGPGGAVPELGNGLRRCLRLGSRRRPCSSRESRTTRSRVRSRRHRAVGDTDDRPARAVPLFGEGLRRIETAHRGGTRPDADATRGIGARDRDEHGCAGPGSALLTIDQSVPLSCSVRVSVAVMSIVSKCMSAPLTMQIVAMVHDTPERVSSSSLKASS